MKKLLLSVIALAAFTIQTNAQIIVRGISPTAIVGNKPFTWADNWGQTPDFNIPGTYVQDTLTLAEDGTPGWDSTVAIPHTKSQEGCSPLINASAVAGKIAVVYRGTCNFSTKALNAQNAGAVAVIIINRDPDPVGMAGGTDGALITIPVVMIGSGPGLDITTAMLAGDVVMFLGNKVGTLANDLVINSEFAKIPVETGTSNLLSDNVFDPAVRAFNFGSTSQPGVSIKLNVNGPGVGGPSVYTNTVAAGAIATGDSAEVVNGGTFSFPTLDMTTLADGEYFLKYTAYSSLGDDDSSDNSYSSSFNVNTNFLSKSKLDANNDPVHTTYPQNTSNPGAYDACMTFTNPAASELMVTGLKFVPSADTSVYDMTGEEIALSIYEWTTPNDETTIVFPPVASVSAYLPGNSVNRTSVYQALTAPIGLTDDVVYLVCATSSEISNVVFGYDGGINFDGTFNYDGLTTSAIQIAGTWYTAGWSGTNALSLALEVAPNLTGLDEGVLLNAVAYPNPTNDELNIRVNAEGTATITFTDLSGKVASTSSMNINNGTATVNTSKLASGAYIANIVAANGASAKINVIKK
jgi:hypothetical protein